MSGVTLQPPSQAAARQQAAAGNACDFVTRKESRDAKFMLFRPGGFLNGMATHRSNTRATRVRIQAASSGYGKRRKFPAENSLELSLQPNTASREWK
jgi:hypothetical protein